MSLDHISDLPEVRRYLDDGKHNFMLHGGFGIRYIRESIADVALAAADREVGRLKAERDALYERRLPYREAEVAQKRYEDAEATIERLSVCGSCGHFSSSLYSCELWPEGGKDASEGCHFTPSRWTEMVTL